MIKALILAGGTGTRLWPVSRKNKPKQVQPFVDDKTLLQKTYERISKGFKKEDIFIVSLEEQKDSIKEQLSDFPEENMIFEPFRKDTAAAIGLAALKIYKRDPEASLVTINSDHFVKNEEEYLRIIKIAEKVINKYPDHTILVGINPSYPETGYGYIKMNAAVDRIENHEIFKAEEFVEKPDLKTAKEYLKKWEYLWNPAIFIWKIDYLLNLFEKYLPDIYKPLKNISDALDSESQREVLQKEFKKIKPISIDYGIMEKLEKMLVIPADFGWADIGNWRTVKDVLTNKEKEDLIKGKNISIDSSGNLIYSLTGKLTATVGVENMIIIETEDAVLVCPKDRAQEVKKIVEKLQKEKLDKYL